MRFGFLIPLGLMLRAASAAPPTGSPSFENEQLHYNVNWPSGLNLGEATFSVSSGKPGSGGAQSLHMEFDLDASIPGFAVADRYRSDASMEFCSTEFDRNIKHGAKKTEETTTFDPKTGQVTRRTATGGQSESHASPCARDALDFLYYLRREWSQGRLPPPQKIFYGAVYDIRLELAGTENIRVGNASLQADRIMASLKGPASSTSFEIWLLRDPARTPALVKVPLAMGTFSMELVK